MPQPVPHRAHPVGRATALVAGALAVALLAGGCGPKAQQPQAAAPGAAGVSGPSGSSSSAPSASVPTSVAASVPASIAAAPPAGAAKAGKPPGTLRPGMKGPYVLAAQRQLSALGYWVGALDAVYGNQTAQAVMALQKAAGLSRDGVLGPKTRAVLAQRVRPTPRTTSGSAIEVDIDRQLVLVVQDGLLSLVLNTSTGSEKPYTSDGKKFVAHTPRGNFRVQRQIDGLRVSRLGELWRPKYFFQGYALHGSPSVPGFPASHGCIRLTNAAIDMLWTSEVAPIGQTVWIY